MDECNFNQNKSVVADDYDKIENFHSSHLHHSYSSFSLFYVFFFQFEFNRKVNRTHTKTETPSD